MVYDFKDIRRDSFKIEDSGLDFAKYEMYYVRYKLNNGQDKVVRAFIDKGTFSENSNIQELKKCKSEYKQFLMDFFVRRLFGPNGYMHDDGRSDMIYLGTITISRRDKAIVDRNHKRPNGKDAHEEFENSLFKLKMQVATKEAMNKLKKSKEKDGKSYVISDIHGMYGSYMEAINQLQENDTLYVLGDVIDRGEYGIEIIQDMMQRDNVNFVMGNHEWYMLKTIDILKKYGLENYNIGQAFTVFNSNTRKMLPVDTAFMFSWMFQNNGIKTITKYLELPQTEQEQIYSYLSNSAIIQKVQTKNLKICLVHACPPNDNAFIDLVESQEEGIVTYKDVNKNLGENCIEYMVEERDDVKGFELWASKGYITIYGHTPQKSARVYRDEEKHRICIDAACSMNGNLAMLCLNDGKAKYITPKEKAENISLGAPEGENR
ncbi:MAG: metallophosphoesterase [Clostridia bacterium]|nr:metallophosphoesterase [Clostridia bacterium]